MELKKERYINVQEPIQDNIKKLILYLNNVYKKGHNLAVYKVKWNNFHPRTFISASADWTVKIWDSKISS